MPFVPMLVVDPTVPLQHPNGFGHVTTKRLAGGDRPNEQRRPADDRAPLSLSDQLGVFTVVSFTTVVELVLAVVPV